jgi:SAM-dependent methyltransferase
MRWLDEASMTVEQRFTFDEIGERYDRYRPGYPDVVFDDLLSISGVSSAPRLLELGCGTGQATQSLARRGFEILCIEPGPRLAELSRKNLSAFPGVEVHCQTFEDWPCETAAFGLVFSAQAFHWLAPEMRFEKCAEALSSGGSLAVLGNSVCVDRSRHGNAGGPLSDRLDAAYARWAPSLAGPPATAWYDEGGPVPQLFAESGRLQFRHEAVASSVRRGDHLLAGAAIPHGAARRIAAMQRGRTESLTASPGHRVSRSSLFVTTRSRFAIR